jgi:hypothetical protein
MCAESERPPDEHPVGRLVEFAIVKAEPGGQPEARRLVETQPW